MPGSRRRASPPRLESHQSSFPSATSRLNPLYNSGLRERTYSPAAAPFPRNRETSAPRDSMARGSSPPRKLVTAANLPLRATPIQVPRASRSRPARMPGWSSQNAAGEAGRRWNSSRLAATTSGRSARTCQPRTIRHIPSFQLLIKLERLLGLLFLVHDGADGLDHGDRVIGLEDVAPHVDARGALVDRLVRHGQGVELGQLLAAGDDDRHRAAGHHALEAFLDEVALDVVCAQLGRDTGGEREVALVALHLRADAGDSHGRNAVAVAGVDELHQVLDRLVLVLGADVDLRRDRAGVQPDGVLD